MKRLPPDADGFVRLICPFHAGRLRAVNLPQSKVSKNAPLVTLPEGVEQCCHGIVTVAPAFFKLAQAQGLLFQTTAWTMAYGTRVLVETANSLTKDKYVTLNRTYTKLMGLSKRRFVLAFLIAAINRRIIRAWRAKQAAAPAHRRRLRKYEDTLTGLVVGSSATTGGTQGVPPISGRGTAPTAPAGRTDGSRPSNSLRKTRGASRLRT